MSTRGVYGIHTVVVAMLQPYIVIVCNNYNIYNNYNMHYMVLYLINYF